MKIGDRVRIVPYHTWRNAFGVIVWCNAFGECWVKLVQPTRRPSYTDWTGYGIVNITHPICVAEEHLEVVS